MTSEDLRRFLPPSVLLQESLRCGREARCVRHSFSLDRVKKIFVQVFIVELFFCLEVWGTCEGVCRGVSRDVMCFVGIVAG